MELGAISKCGLEVLVSLEVKVMILLMRYEECKKKGDLERKTRSLGMYQEW
jgi:hypothetical protein